MNKARIRTAKACNNCRLRKVKCDGSTNCPNCDRYHVVCEYSEELDKPRKKRGRKPLNREKKLKIIKEHKDVTIESRLSQLEESVRVLLEKVDELAKSRTSLSSSSSESVASESSEIASELMSEVTSPMSMSSSAEFYFNTPATFDFTNEFQAGMGGGPELGGQQKSLTSELSEIIGGIDVLSGFEASRS